MIPCECLIDGSEKFIRMIYVYAIPRVGEFLFFDEDETGLQWLVVKVSHFVYGEKINNSDQLVTLYLKGVNEDNINE